MASVRPGPFQDFYQRSLAKGIKPTMARLNRRLRLVKARKNCTPFISSWHHRLNTDSCRSGPKKSQRRSAWRLRSGNGGRS